MKYLLKQLQKQQETVEGEKVVIDGEEFKLGALSEDEKKEMIEEGKELANKTFNINGKETKLIDVESGKKLFEYTEVLELEGNFTGFWYIWRHKKIQKEFNKKSKKAQEDLKEILATKGLDKYLEL